MIPTRAHIITGSFGSGKTIAIRWLMSCKPEEQLWVVFSMNSPMPASTRLASPKHRAEITMCDWSRRMLVLRRRTRVWQAAARSSAQLKPARSLIEPSGAGHAADIIDMLSVYETQNALQLDSVICLIDPQDARRILDQRPPVEWSQIQSADALLLSKPDLANEQERQDFARIAAEQFPQKLYLGTCSHGELPREALRKYEREPRFSLIAKSTAVADPQSGAFETEAVGRRQRVSAR